MNKLLHAFIRKGEKSKRSTSPLWREMLFLLVLFTTLGSMDLKAQTITIDGSTTDWNFANFSLNPVKVYKPDAHGNGVVDDQFTTGSKDFFFASAIEWEIGQTKGKNDIANAAAVISNGILYFAGDRSTNEGDAQIGFWLYLNGTGPRVLKTSPKVGGDFFPEHRIGDLFILSDFTGGGRTGTVSVYRWVGTGGNVVGSNGTLNTTSIVGNVAENNKDQDGDISTVPTGWFLKDKDGNATAEYEQNQFFEGQVLLNGEDFDLDDVDLCQASILIETRSSQSITASLDDFVGGSFNITPTVTVNSPTVCASALPTTITATPGDGTPNQFNYTWAVPPAYVGNPGNVQSFQTSVAGTYTVTITRKGLECPSAPASGVLTIKPTSSSIQNRTICSNQLPYTWDGQTFTAAGQKVKTGLTNAVGCDSTATYNLTVNPLPIISCSATPTLIDITSAAHNTQMNVDLSLNADTDPTHYTYAWTEDGAGSFNFNNIKNPVYTAGVLDAGQVISFTVTVTNKLTGCVSESKCSVTVNSAGSCPGVPTSEVCNGSTNTYTADRAATANETWKWTVNNGASIVGADNGQSVTVTAGSQAFTLTLTVSYANTELSPTTCKYEVATTPCGGYCTYTQGKYGNKSPACDGDGNGDGTPITYPSVVEMIKAMLGVGGVANPLYIGGDGITKPRVTIPATATAAVLLNASMPGGSTARELIGNCTVDNAGGLPACWTASTNTLTSYLTKQGKINNVFLSQTIALGLNMRVSGGLGGFALQAGTFATAKAVGGCGSTTALQRSCYLNELGQLVVVNEYVYKTIGQDIINALTCKGYPLTVAGLYQLANDGLANADGVVGSECGASLSSISGAAASINEGFDECRIAIGWNVGPCEIPTRRININTSGVITSPDLNAQMVDAIRVSAYPNPFAEKVSFVIVSPVSGKASLEVYNMFGQKLQTVFEGYMTAGRNQLVEYRPGTNAAGTLIYKFSIDGKQVTGKLINLKQ